MLTYRELTFSWNPVASDCLATHYNILASNCGSCPTTTNHTTVTCTDIPTCDNVCSFAVQTVVCENITGNFSTHINTNTGILFSTETNNVYIASIGSLTTALIVSITALSTVIVVILARSKAKIEAALDLQATNRTGRSIQMESMYEDPLPSVSTMHSHTR